MNIVSFTANKNKPDYFVKAELLHEKGWMVDHLTSLACILLTVLPANVGAIDDYIADLKAANPFAEDNPREIAKGECVDLWAHGSCAFQRNG